MAAHGVKTFIYSSTCATYGEPKQMPITELTPQVSLYHYLPVECCWWHCAFSFTN